MQILYQLSICFTLIVAVRIRPGMAGHWANIRISFLQLSGHTGWEIRRQKVKVNIPVLKAGTGSLSVPAVWSLCTGQPWYCWIGLYFVAWQPSVFLQWVGLSSGRLSYCQTQHQHQQRLHRRTDGGLASAWNFYSVIPVYPRCDEIRSQYKLQSFQTCW